MGLAPVMPAAWAPNEAGSTAVRGSGSCNWLQCVKSCHPQGSRTPRDSVVLVSRLVLHFQWPSAWKTCQHARLPSCICCTEQFARGLVPAKDTRSTLTIAFSPFVWENGVVFWQWVARAMLTTQEAPWQSVSFHTSLYHSKPLISWCRCACRETNFPMLSHAVHWASLNDFVLAKVSLGWKWQP